MSGFDNYHRFKGYLPLFIFVSVIFFAKIDFASALDFTPPPIRDYSYQAKFVSQSVDDPITVEAGKTADVAITFKNTGTAAWYSVGNNYVSAYTVDPNYRKSQFAGAVWISKDNPVKINGIVKPGKTGQIKIKLYAPQTAGQYTEKFYLAAENKTWIKGGYFFLKINVAAKKQAPAPVTIEAATGTVQTTGIDAEATTSADSVSTSASPSPRALINQPNIRIGLYKTDKPVDIETDFPFEIYSGQTHQGTLYVGSTSTISYQNGIYYFQSSLLNFNSSDRIRFVPDDMSYYFTLANYDREVSGRPKNFNMYRGVLEYVYSPKSSMPYVIEELPLDEYVAGIAETSNDSAMEYIKALLVAARTYGYTNIDPQGPTDSRMFDVYPNTADQLYLGYNSEVLMPRVAAAEQATFGQMVTYHGTPAKTYYFGHSDGRTRSWTEVWGGNDKPWLQSVEAVYDKGLTLWGHGIGMSTHDASARAQKDGWAYDQLLKYYYTGTEVEKIY